FHRHFECLADCQIEVGGAWPPKQVTCARLPWVLAVEGTDRAQRIQGRLTIGIELKLSCRQHGSRLKYRKGAAEIVRRIYTTGRNVDRCAATESPDHGKLPAA